MLNVFPRGPRLALRFRRGLSSRTTSLVCASCRNKMIKPFATVAYPQAARKVGFQEQSRSASSSSSASSAAGTCRLFPPPSSSEDPSKHQKPKTIADLVAIAKARRNKESSDQVAELSPFEEVVTAPQKKTKTTSGSVETAATTTTSPVEPVASPSNITSSTQEGDAGRAASEQAPAKPTTRRRAGVACLLRRGKEEHQDHAGQARSTEASETETGTTALSRNYEVFLILRQQLRNDPWSGQVAFPGGKSEKDESLLETCLREVKEEVGIDLEKNKSAHFVCALDPISVAKSLDVWCLVFEIAEEENHDKKTQKMSKKIKLQQSEVQAAGWFDLIKNGKPATLRTDLREHKTFTKLAESSYGFVSPELLHRVTELFGLHEAAFSGQVCLPTELYAIERSGSKAKTETADFATVEEEFKLSWKTQEYPVNVSGWNPGKVKGMLRNAIKNLTNFTAVTGVCGDRDLIQLQLLEKNPFLLWGLTQQLLDMVISRTNLPKPMKPETKFFGKKYAKRFGSSYHDILFGLTMQKHLQKDRHWLDLWQRYFQFHVAVLCCGAVGVGGVGLGVFWKWYFGGSGKTRSRPGTETDLAPPEARL
ncbi:unnamed protein product [Amoebophrya sp. A120]|nr:unnamed protein product [Amoebophrya sp. A120]|eukprot:GSA120T00019640001.1